MEKRIDHYLADWDKVAHRYNCVECMVRTGNDVYALGLSESTMDALRAFGGGMKTGHNCGIFTAGAFLIGVMYSDAWTMEAMLKRWEQVFSEQFGSVECKVLKGDCAELVKQGAALFDRINGV